jgi:cell division protease FtsH
VHCKGKRIGHDVDLGVVARGTPGMSGADLANLVNEAALHAGRRGALEVAMVDFEAARDRVLMGQRRESVLLSEKEKEATAFHEGGHAVTAYVLPDADPVHKVTILPTGVALGATQQLPLEERHTYWREHLDAALAVMMGGRCAERLMLGSLSTGAGNDLQRATEMARKMVRELGMSDRIGPMAWGSQGQVFLGEDLLHTKDYSDDTSRVIDQEVEKILRSAEERSMQLLTEHRAGLEAVAAALLQKETLDGAEVSRLVDAAAGRPIHTSGPKSLAVPRFTGATGTATPPAPPPANGRPDPAPQGYPTPAQAPAPSRRPSGPYDAERDSAWPAPG